MVRKKQASTLTDSPSLGLNNYSEYCSYSFHCLFDKDQLLKRKNYFISTASRKSRTKSLRNYNKMFSNFIATLRFFVAAFHIFLPAQTTPSPVKPGRQTHLWRPGPVFWQTVFLGHRELELLQGSISENHIKTCLYTLYIYSLKLLHSILYNAREFYKSFLPDDQMMMMTMSI